MRPVPMLWMRQDLLAEIRQVHLIFPSRSIQRMGSPIYTTIVSFHSPFQTHFRIDGSTSTLPPKGLPITGSFSKQLIVNVAQQGPGEEKKIYILLGNLTILAFILTGPNGNFLHHLGETTIYLNRYPEKLNIQPLRKQHSRFY